MDKRYQVFVSSTYTDLQDERKNVTQTLMEMDCIPAGMELFPAVDEGQWDFIKKVIDDCDYYILIIGGRYGTLGGEGISYTEKEYDYAVEKGIKVIAFVHGSPDEISTAKSELSPELREKLNSFRGKVTAGRLVKYWNSASELPGLVSLSLMRTIKIFPAVGWVRGGEGSNQQLLLEINELRKANNSLEAKVLSYEQKGRDAYDIPDLAGFDDIFRLHGHYDFGEGLRTWSCDFTWGEIFSMISPYIISPCHQGNVYEVLKVAAGSKLENTAYLFALDDQLFQTIAIQMRVLGLVDIKPDAAGNGGGSPLWELTPKGERIMVDLRAVRS